MVRRKTIGLLHIPLNFVSDYVTRKLWLDMVNYGFVLLHTVSLRMYTAYKINKVVIFTVWFCLCLDIIIHFRDLVIIFTRVFSVGE